MYRIHILFRSRKMELLEFKKILLEKDPEQIVCGFLESKTIAAFQEDQYKNFCEEITCSFEKVESVRIMGSGNYKFSLNPDNIYREFNERSDIDTVIISSHEFQRNWEELRKYNRSKWYTLGKNQKEKLMRNGQNIYSGFVSPLWIPDKSNRLRFKFIRTRNRLSIQFDSREVNMLFFKNYEEVIDYYKRSVMSAKRELLKNGL